MKRKQRRKIALLLVVVSIAIIGIIGGNRMNEPTEKEKQIAFLKTHEEEMTEYVKKSEGNKVSEVEYKWNTVKTDKGMAFTKDFLTIKVNIYDEKKVKLNGFWINIFVDNTSNPKKIDRIN